MSQAARILLGSRIFWVVPAHERRKLERQVKGRWLPPTAALRTLRSLWNRPMHQFQVRRALVQAGVISPRESHEAQWSSVQRAFLRTGARIALLEQSRRQYGFTPQLSWSMPPDAPLATPDEVAADGFIGLSLVDAFGNPKEGLQWQLTDAQGGQHNGNFGASPSHIEPIAAGSATIELRDVPPADWRLRGAPPVGWPQREVELQVCDDSGYPLAELDFELRFDSGETVSATLDSSGRKRLREAPSGRFAVFITGYAPYDYDTRCERLPLPAEEEAIHASPTLLERGVRGRTGEPNRIVVHHPRQPMLRVEGAGFAFGSSFPGLAVLNALPVLRREALRHPARKLMCFGHTDEEGSEDVNKKESDLRATALHAMLTNDQEAFDQLADEDRWELTQYQEMLTALGFQMPIDGEPGPKTERGARRFQKAYNAGLFSERDEDGAPRAPSAALAVDGKPGPKTRQALRHSYLFRFAAHLPPERFFDTPKAGCSEFNLVGAPDVDRRVTLAIIDPATAPASVPCTQDDAGACPVAKGSDGEPRCRFYGRWFANESVLAVSEGGPPHADDGAASVITAPDLTFHHDSPVFLGETGSLTSSEAERGTSGIDVLATALTYAQTRPGKRLLVVGHTDQTGDPAHNEALSEKRALNIKHLLSGERDEWVALAKDHSTIADIQQICGWASLVRGWPCAPIEVNGEESDDNARIIEAFQIAYNHDFDADISEDGKLGPQTWGAVYDFYLEQLQYRLETDADGLKNLQSSLQFIAAGPVFGCGPWLPVDASVADASENRRVELLFFDQRNEPGPEELVASAACELTPENYDFEAIEVVAGPALVWISLQTVDELGHRLPDVELVFRSGEHEVHHSTDGRGIWQGQVRRQGVIEVRVADGRELGFGAAAELGDSVELLPEWASTAVTDLMVAGTVDPGLLQEHAQHVARYDAAPESSNRTLRTGLPAGPSPAREPMVQPAPSGEGEMPTRRAIRARAADNLFMAAELDFEKLSDVIDQWLGDYHPEVRFRGYFLEMLVGNKLAIFDSAGNASHLFELAPDVEVRGGRTGLHALVETGKERDEDGALFVDLAQGRTVINIGRSGEEENEETTDDDKIKIVRTEQMVAPSDRQAYLDVLWGARVRGLFRLAYLWRPDSGFIAAMGGTGVLESYPKDAQLREHVHARNTQVVKTAKRAYGSYIDGFIDQVLAIDADPAAAEAAGLKHPELQLYDLLPPWSAPVIPTPPGITDAELSDLLEQNAGTSEFQAWKAITEKHNEIWGVRTAGSMWLATEFQVEGQAGAEGGGKLVLKLNFEVSTDRTTDAIRVTPTAEKKIYLHNVEVDTDTGVVKGTLKNERLLGKFEVEADSTGKVTMKYGLAQASYDRTKRQVGLGGSISLRDLVRKGTKWGPLGEPEWVKSLPDVKLEASLNAQLSRPSDIMAIVMRSPGLLELGPRHVFMNADWGSLRQYQRDALEVLGWTERRWDTKDLPESAKKPFDELSPEQMEAALQLPIPKEGNWLEFWGKFTS